MRLKFIAKLLIVTIISSSMTNVVLAKQDERPNPRKTVTLGKNDKPAKILGENTNKKGRNIKEFIKDDGTFQSNIYPTAVSYLENGQWKDIDNSLIDQNNSLQNKNNNFKVKMSKDPKSEHLIKITEDKYEISWGLENSQGKDYIVSQKDENSLNDSLNKLALQSINNDIKLSQKTEKEKQEIKDIIVNNEKKQTLSDITSGITYSNILPNVDLNYNLISDTLKENIIVNKPTQNIEFKFYIYSKNLFPVVNNDNSISLFDDTNKSNLIFKIGSPIMFDSKKHISNKIEVSLKKSDEKYELILRPDNEWLNSKATVYPITIDPPLQSYLNSSYTSSSFVSSKFPDKNFSSEGVVCTGNDQYYYSHTSSYVKFNLPSLTSAQNIISAYYSVVPWSIDYIDFGNRVDLYKVTSDWNAQQITYNNKPSIDYNIIDSQFVSDSTFRYKWDITKIVKDWYNGGSNYGIMLNDTTDETFIEWCNGGYCGPELTLNYNNTSGLESYWSYHTQNIERAGTGYVNDYSGNLVLVHNDLKMSGNRMPVNLNHIYDSSNANTNIGFGNGWITNFNQTVRPININNEIWYEYCDEDGTKHYYKFNSSSNTYTDELNLGYNLIKNTDGTYTISGKDYIKLNFNSSGYLASLVDQNNNIISINYNGTNISTISDGVGRTTTFNYTLTGKLDNISDPSNRKTQFIYTNNQLTGVIYPDGKQTTYSYNTNNTLKTAINFSGYKIDYTYYDNAPYRMKKVQEGNIDGTKGGELNICYDYNMSIFTDANLRKEVYQFNNSGNIVGIRDSQGNGQFYKIGDSVNPTKLTATSKLQGTTVNYLQDHNAEIGGYWIEGGTEAPAEYSQCSAIYTTEDKYLGKSSLKVTKPMQNGRHYLKESVTLQVGKTYTFSAYVKTSNISAVTGTGAGISIGYYDKNNIYQTFDSNLLSGTNDWNRVQFSFTLPSDAKSNTVYAQFGIINATGIAFFDCLQLESGSISNRYNLIENSSFEYGTNTPNFWTVYNGYGTTSLTNEKAMFGGNSIKVSQRYDYNAWGDIIQNINISGKQNDAFVVGGWGLGNSMPLNKYTTFGIKVDFIKSNSTVQSQTLSFNQAVLDWQYMCDSVVATSDFDSIKLVVSYENNSNQAYFDGIQLYKDEFGSNCIYDSNGNLKTNNSPGSVVDNYQYTGNDLTSESNSDGSSTNYHYDSNHNLDTETSGEGVITTIAHDSFGNQTSTKLGNDTTFIKEGSTYNSNGNYLYTHTDSTGNITTTTYDETKGLLNSVFDPENVTTSYLYYDNTNMLKSVSTNISTGQATSSYVYENDRLKNITAPNGQTYNFGYNSLGQNTTVSVGIQNLATNNYEPSTGNLLSSIYGNGQKVSSDFDNKDRVISQKYNDSIICKYEYNSEGELGFKQDITNDTRYWYSYDLQGNIANIVDSNGNQQIYQNNYNANSTTIKEIINGVTFSTSYFNNKDNNLKQVGMNSGAKLDYNYDSLSRLYNKTLSTGTATISSAYTFSPGIGGSQSSQVESITNNDDKISYTYYRDGNIKTITRNGKEIMYYYNELKELTQEDNQETNKTIVYQYDLGGNLTSKKEYPYKSLLSPTRTIIYQYTDTNWKDKLTNYDGKVISYDNIGNPLSYDGYSFNWEKGRQLKSVSKNDSTTNLNVSYKYNDSGIRTEKTFNGTTTFYHLSGNNVTFETDGTNKIYYTYDSDNQVISMNLNGADYYYSKNAQNDIIGLFDKSGIQVVSYTYDSWGKLLSIDGSLKDTVGMKNPYRYRGYRYDTETGLYYLQSRYYNAEWGRFVNADDADVLQLAQGKIIGTNLFTYCLNNPITNSDPSGYWVLCTVDTCANWIDAILIAASWAVGLGSAITAIKQGGAAFAKKIGIRMAKSMAEKALRKACWFLSAGTIYAMTNFIITAMGFSVGKLLAMWYDSRDSHPYNRKIDI